MSGFISVHREREREQIQFCERDDGKDMKIDLFLADKNNIYLIVHLRGPLHHQDKI